MTNGIDGLLVVGNGSAKFKDIGSNGFANGNNVELVIALDSIRL